MVSAVLFDIDGTLIDSRESLMATYKHICHAASIEANAEGFSGLLGKTLPEIFSKLHPQVDPEYFAAEFAARSRLEEAKLKAYEGAVALVSYAAQESNFCGYLTSKDKARALRSLDLLGFPKLEIFSPTSNLRPKPSPDLFNTARKASSLTRGLYLGDTNDDRKAAEEAGFDFIFAEWGYGQLASNNSSAKRAASPVHGLQMMKDWLA